MKESLINNNDKPVIQFTNEELVSLVSFNMSFERQPVTKEDEEKARLELEKIDFKKSKCQINFTLILYHLQKIAQKCR